MKIIFVDELLRKIKAILDNKYFEIELHMNFFAYARYFFTAVFFVGSFNAQTQTPTLASVQNSITTLADNFPQEKIYMQFDKPSYAPGETIWFKTYIMAGADPSLISKTVYVDFLNTDGRIIKHCVSPVLQSGAAGDYDIPLEFKDDIVYVKAYTKWMMNFDSAFWFRKTIHIIQSKPAAKKQLSPATKTAIQFLPEGGYMIENIESNVAFKAVHFDGSPASVKGEVFNDKNQQVAEMKTVHDGMGSFLLNPKNGETYTAKWKDDLGISYQTKLPVAKNEGALFKINWQPTARSFLIQRTENAGANFQKLYIVATMQQHLVYAANVNLSQAFITGGAIPVSNLPSGILQITLFDSNWNAIAERITFINNNNYSFEPEVGFAQLGTDKRKPNTLVIETPDSISANLSVAVTDAGIGIDSSDDIISRLLMTADIKGNVYHPYYYFTNNNDTLQQQLDLVMLTNGWRRIPWNNVVYNKYPQIKYQNDTDYLSLSGKVYGATSGDLKAGAFVLMIIKNNLDTANHVEQAVVDNSGNFSNPDIILYDTSKIYYRISGTQGFANSSVVSFNSSLPSTKLFPADTVNNAYYADTATENYKRRIAQEQMQLLKLQQGTTLESVTVTTKAKSPLQIMDEKYTSALFSGSDAYQFNVLDDPLARSAMNVLQYLQGKVAGLTITAPAGINGTGSATWRGGSPSFFYNESPVDISYLSSINMSDVAYIKVFRPPFFGAIDGGANGAIAIYTRKGNEGIKTDNSKGIPYKVVIGYTAPKEFYSPNYDTYNEKNEQKDMRTTLYWAPTIITNPGSNKVRIKFYNNDFSQSFRVIVEGMTTDGKLAHIEKVIE
ncbi:MAG: hypothetical protein JO072_01420 [Parafilimonas sp.]|nr:hypothetical protein [Parafilimonas sp.]